MYLFMYLIMCFSFIVSFEQLLERHMEKERIEAEEEERQDDALTRTVFEAARGHIKRLRDDLSEEDDVIEIPARRKNIAPPPSRPKTSSRAKLETLVKKKVHSKVSPSLLMLHAYSDDSD